ncbi:batten's disease protein Cln3 [Lipomyces tetrasporus]|uniref:Protein BTN n=1 Tax=Lipomyces tetrasporus TaxID=54092 RepID=A0AAD7R1A9_9ASCO|nr:batten's disease protein Cln3 [Lipomyces tetrasporus]KAJ8103982.1 batten's disease protein Cln3 [Lipomyces tetrasporus]
MAAGNSLDEEREIELEGAIRRPQPSSPTTSSRSRLFAAFWLYGLINNVLYVIILSAALDLVGANVPKATVLLADVMPSFFVKLSAPFYIHRIAYKVRIFMLVALSLFGMQCVALTSSISARLFGVVLASLSSGLGELTFLQLTHFYSPLSLAGFSSGTGGAGLVGSFLYLVATTWLRLSVRGTIFASSLLPLIFFFAFFWIMPQPDPLLVSQSSTFTAAGAPAYSLLRYEEHGAPASESIMTNPPGNDQASISSGIGFSQAPSLEQVMKSMSKTLSRLGPLFVPYMLPLMLVYIGEYVINQGVSPTLLFPIEEMPFTYYRDAYVTYGTLYQLGVFISRSSSHFVRIRKLYVPAALQLINVVILVAQSMYSFIPDVYIIMIIIFYEGLLGGAAYINTFLLVSETVAIEDREFAMGAVGVSDSGGIVIAGTICLYLETYLCSYQKTNGRPYCGMT